ncbi:zinc metalloprotease [Allorhodopirellula solitaria]|uniref:Peptidase family M50 n=1 Tax=Allorhodopirellula solitaria TaxID=2527987 RepID=A0A5C5XTU8_9BACT|nr:M50 family metallopeptidase [Allorhodopirellula solitaria]TWT66647.1 Peptidase family M50 [Allorhodopirellula solitaria]
MSIPRLQLRRDLIMRRISLRDRCVWVLKDPLSSAFHFFDEAEFAILRRLRDGVSFATLATRYRDRLPPAALAEFLSAATRAGILITPDGAAASPAWRPASRRPQPAWWKNPLAIRLPGITPDRLGALFRPTPAIDASHDARHSPGRLHGIARVIPCAVAAIVVVAVVVVGMNQQALIEDFAAAGSRLVAPANGIHGSTGASPLTNTLLAFAIAIAVTKIFHELAHAWVCQKLGGRCREIGVLLLFGVPCLYCDVSEAWLMPRRRDRILVSAAGVLAEWIVAAIAVILWASTRSGLLHDVSALIVVVASVSTLLVNANPLLRYDGYYILSDAVGVPNLAHEATLAIRQTWASWVSGDRTSQSAALPRPWLVAYGIASWIYRLVILCMIGWLMFSFLKAWFGIGLAVPVTVGLVSLVLRQRMNAQLASGPLPTDAVAQRWRRPAASAAILLASGLVLCIPLPHSLRVGSLIRPSGERPLFAAASGMIMPRTSGTAMRLDDWRLRWKELASLGRIAELESEFAATRIDRVDRPSLSITQPVVASQIASEREHHATLVSRLDQLRCSLGPGEKLYAPPSRQPTREERMAGRWGWTGTPLDPDNVGATLTQGTLVGRAGSPDRRTASLYVPEQSIDNVRLGQLVRVGYRGLPSGSVRGHVESISADPVDEVPEEIVASGWIPNNSSGSSGTIPSAVHYEVVVMIDEASPVLPARLVTAARIEFAAASLWSRWRKWFRQ